MRAWLWLLIGFVAGAGAGAGGMLIAFPFLFPPVIVAEAAPEAGASTIKAGSFRFDETAKGRDAVHWANGSGGVYQSGGVTTVRLDDDFVAGPGPNYWIYLNTVPVGDETDFLADTKRVRIAPLKSFKGGQNFALPADVKFGEFATLTIWCESFSAYIASAALPKS